MILKRFFLWFHSASDSVSVRRFHTSYTKRAYKMVLALRNIRDPVDVKVIGVSPTRIVE